MTSFDNDFIVCHKKVAIKTFSRFCHLGAHCLLFCHVVYLKSISVSKILIGCFNFDWVLIVRRLDTVFQLSILKYFVGVGSKMDVATIETSIGDGWESKNVKYEPILFLITCRENKRCLDYLKYLMRIWWRKFDRAKKIKMQHNF